MFLKYAVELSLDQEHVSLGGNRVHAWYGLAAVSGWHHWLAGGVSEWCLGVMVEEVM